MYTVVVAKQALKDFPKLSAAKLDDKAKALIEVLKEDPFQNPPFFKKLIGDLDGLYSRRINHKHHLVYQVYENEKVVKIVSARSYYENI